MCPLCSAPTLPIDSTLAYDKWASVFPLNTIIHSLLESTKCLNSSDIICGPCKTDGDTSTAEFWCNECREKICHSCYKSHKRIKLLKHHKIVPMNEMEQGIHTSVEFNLECGRHRDKLKELFCLDHRELCCAVCIAIDHRQCKDVRSIDDIIRDQSQRSTTDYSSIIQDFRQLKTEMAKIVTEKEGNSTHIMQEKDQILNDMDSRIDQIIVHLNRLKKEFRNETDQLYKATECSMVENKETVQRFITNIDNSREILEVVENSGTLQQKFTTFEDIRSQIMSHYNQVNLSLNDDVEVHFTLKASTFLNNLEKTMKTIGSVEASEKSSTTRDVLHSANRIMKNLNSHTKINTEMCAAQVEKVQDLMTSPVSFVQDLTRDKFGSRTQLSGGTFLGDNRLVMADRSNHRLVELDDEYNIVKEYKIDGAPTDVAAGNKDNAVYIAVNGAYIYICTLRTNLTIVSRITAPAWTWGIAVSGDNIIVGTDDAVVILTQDGSTVRSIPKSKPYAYVAVSQTQRTIYHRDKDDVVCRTWEGQEVFRYRHGKLKEVRGIFTDKHNNVYICGRLSDYVHQISHDGQRNRIIKLHKINQPWNVMLHPKKNQLIVSSWNDDMVCQIYKLG